MIMSGERITAMDLPVEILAPNGVSQGQYENSPLKEFRDKTERDFIISALKKNKGNISQAATDLGIGRSYLHKRIVLLKIHKKDYFA
jgi:transcriptional regulator of acetoin/glycerol metabolism